MRREDYTKLLFEGRVVEKIACPFCNGSGCDECGFLGNVDRDVANELQERYDTMFDMQLLRLEEEQRRENIRNTCTYPFEYR